jgi:hypothetical protein
VRAPPRNLTRSNRRLRKDKEKHEKKLRSGGLGALVETHKPPPPLVSLLYTVANKEVEQQFLGGMAL